MYIPPTSQNSYYQNYYGAGYGRPGYSPVAPYPNGGYGYGVPPRNQASSPQIYGNYGANRLMQPMKLDIALNKSSYSSTNRDIILETMLDNFSDKKEDKVYFQSLSNQKIFVIMKSLSCKLVNKTYNIPMVIIIPASYPNSPAEFYIHKKPKVGISKVYYETQKIIDTKTFKINTDYICPFNPSRNNLGQIIEALKKKFGNDFPIYSDKNSNSNQAPPFGPNNPDIRKMNEVIIESEKLTNKQVVELIRKQTRDIVLRKYNDTKGKYKLNENYKELKTINDIFKLKAGNSLNGNEHPMNESLNFLKNIKQKLSSIENGLNQEMQNYNNNKTTLEKCDELIKIKDDEDMKLLMMKKTIEDYLAYLKKGYERKVVSFNDMVYQTRALSREMFTIDYLRAQRKFQTY